MKGSSEVETETALLFDKRDGIATLTLNRPAARNALTAAMFLDMERILIEIAADEEIRVVVLTGAGAGFSAGADLKPVSKEERRRTRASSFPGDLGGDILDRGNRCILRMRGLPKPVLGSVNGDAEGIPHSARMTQPCSGYGEDASTSKEREISSSSPSQIATCQRPGSRGRGPGYSTRVWAYSFATRTRREWVTPLGEVHS